MPVFLAKLRYGAGTLCRGVTLLLCLLLFPGTASPFSFEAGKNKDSLVFHLDSPHQIRSAKRSKNDLILTLSKPCGIIQHLWHATDDSQLARAVLLEYDHIRVRLAPTVSNFSITRSDPMTLRLTLEIPGPEKADPPRTLSDPGHLPPAASSLVLPPVVSKADRRAQDSAKHRNDVRKALRGIAKLPYSQMQHILGSTSAAETRCGDSFVVFLSDVGSAIVRFFVADACAAENDRALSIAPQDIRALVNMNGPESWPENESLGTKAGQQPVVRKSANEPGLYSDSDVGKKQFETGERKQTAEPQNEPVALPEPAAAPFPPNTPPQPVQEPAAHNEATLPVSTTQPLGTVPDKSHKAKASTEQEGMVAKKEHAEEKKEEVEREVIYVDESGNPVEKPLDIKALEKEAETLMEQRKYDDALVILSRLKKSGELSSEQYEKVLYAISDCYWFRYERDPIAGYEDIVSTTNQALVFNMRSERVPEAMLRLALINMSVKNIEEGEGFLLSLLRRYPSFSGTALGLTNLGKIFYDRGDYQNAEKYYSIVLDKFPESAQLKDASVGLIRVFYKENKRDKARLILDFVNKRWPRQYVDDPTFLLIQAGIEKEFDLRDRQVQTLWLLYNLLPTHEEIIPLFLEMGDLYLAANNPTAASFLYSEILKRAPESEESITARIRLAEQGVYSTPLSPNTMNLLFGRGANPPFWQVYQDASKRSQTNPDAVLARLKYALWLIWDKQYPEAMSAASEFIDEYPDHPDKKVAEDIIWKAFQEELSLAFTEQNYVRIERLWNAFSLVRKRYGAPDEKLRFALAMGKKAQGDTEGAMQLFTSFLTPQMNPQYGETAFLELFTLYLANSRWHQILDLGKAVENWNLKPSIKKDLAYAMALSAQNLNLPGTALSLWQKIAADPEAQTYQKAWAMVFLAQDAERRKDIRQAYANNMRVIELFTRLQEERSDKADPERIKNAMISLMDICEVANRIPEALQWINRYHAFAPNDSREYPSLRYREARLHRKLGDTNRAQALLEEIIKNYPDSPYAQAAKTELDTFEISRDLRNFQAEQN
ncbi:MAG: tetratricopeptide repeat protein [Desulfovibrionaceae bacterium]|nr:tetratricopeptide repeat protein [Desulfovibrionaceae bacterium]